MNTEIEDIINTAIALEESIGDYPNCLKMSRDTFEKLQDETKEYIKNNFTIELFDFDYGEKVLLTNE